METRLAAGSCPGAALRPAALFYRMTADADPGLLPRVLEVFAKRSLVPDAVHAERPGHGDGLSVELRIAPLEADKARHVAACLRETVGVRTLLGPVALESD